MAKGPREWSPRDRVKQLEILARDMVGDGGNPNLFFVSVEGNIILISKDFDIAYRTWRHLAVDRDQESALEDRKMGTVASVEPESDEPGARLIVIDDSGPFKR